MENTYNSFLVMKINAIKPSLKRAELLVADYISENPHEVIRLSVSDLAEKCGASEATVVRTCRKFGVQGYQELKVSLARDIVAPTKTINEDISENDSDSTVISKVFTTAINTLELTRESIDEDEMIRAVDALMSAKRICILGLGNSHSSATDLRHKLLRMGLNAVAYTDSHFQTIASVFMGEGDVFFAISHSGSSKTIVETVRLAKSNGATIISLTNIGHSPLGNLADINLYTMSNETQYRILALSSKVAQTVIINTIYSLIALKKQDAIEKIEKVEKALISTKY